MSEHHLILSVRRLGAAALTGVVILAIAAGTVAAQVPDSATADTIGVTRLPPIHVTALGGPSDLRRAAQSVTVVSADETLRGRAGDAMEDALRFVPGVWVANRYNYAVDERVTIRSAGARAAFGVRGVQLVLDGVPQTLADGQGQLTTLDLAAVDRIEVVRGPAASLYGNAAAGVVALTSRAASRRRGGSVLTVGAAHGFRKVAADGAAAIGNVSLGAAASWTDVDGFREHSAARAGRATLHLGADLAGGWRLAVTGHGGAMPRAENPGALTRAEFDASPEAADSRNVDADARKRVSQAEMGISLARHGGSGPVVDLSAFGARRDLLNPLAFGTVELRRWAYGARASANIVGGVAGRAAITAGLDVIGQHDDRGNRSRTDQPTLDQAEDVIELGPYVRAAVPIGDRWSATAGLRYDRVRFRVADRLPADGDQSGTRTMGALSWSVGGTVEWGRGLAPFASIGTAFETPTTTELVNRPTGGGGLNPELDPQRSIMIEAGARGDVGTATRYRVAFYGARTTDALIPFEVPSEPGRQFYRNAGVTRTRGIELEVEARPWPALRAAVTYTVQDARFVEFESPGGTFDGNAVPGAPRHHLIWALDLAVGGGVWAIVEGTHASAQYADDANSARAEGWWTADVRVGWWYARRGVSLEPFVAVRNLLDRRYAASVVVNAAGGRYYEPAPGRTAMAGVKVGW